MNNLQIGKSRGLELLCSYGHTKCHGLNLYSAISASLTEREVYLIMTDDSQDRVVRDAVMKRVINDLTHGNCSHRQLIKYWIQQFQSADAKVKREGSYNLTRVIPLCRGDYSKLIISFLTDVSPLIRRRGNNLIICLHKKDETALTNALEKAWVDYEDEFMARTVCERASVEFLNEHFTNLWQVGPSGIIVRRLYEGGYNILDTLKCDYPEDYLYYSAIFHEDVSDEIVLKILSEYKHSEKVARLLWSVGYMKKYDVLRELLKPEWSVLFNPHMHI